MGRQALCVQKRARLSSAASGENADFSSSESYPASLMAAASLAATPARSCAHGNGVQGLCRSHRAMSARRVGEGRWAGFEGREVFRRRGGPRAVLAVRLEGVDLYWIAAVRGCDTFGRPRAFDLGDDAARIRRAGLRRLSEDMQGRLDRGLIGILTAPRRPGKFRPKKSHYSETAPFAAAFAASSARITVHPNNKIDSAIPPS